MTAAGPGIRPSPAPGPAGDDGGSRRVLAAVELDVVWEELGLGPTPVVLALASPGRTHTERRRIVADARAGLRHRGLAGPDGPEAGLARRLRLLAGAATGVEVRTWGPVTRRALVAGTPEGAVVALREGEAVTLGDAGSLPGAVVGVLPPVVAGSGRAANVPTAALAAALDRPSGAGLAVDLHGRGVPRDEAHLLARMLEGTSGRAEISAVAVDRWGARRRCPELLVVLDGPRGRYLLTGGADGPWTTVAPTDTRRLRHRVAALLGARPPDQSRSSWRISCRLDSVIEPDSDG